MKDESLVREVVNAIKNIMGLKIISLDLEDLEIAIEIMQSYKLDYEDALHLTIALKHKVKEIISNDNDFDRTPLKRKF